MSEGQYFAVHCPIRFWNTRLRESRPTIASIFVTEPCERAQRFRFDRILWACVNKRFGERSACGTGFQPVRAACVVKKPVAITSFFVDNRQDGLEARATTISFKRAESSTVI